MISETALDIEHVCFHCCSSVTGTALERLIRLQLLHCFGPYPFLVFDLPTFAVSARLLSPGQALAVHRE